MPRPGHQLENPYDLAPSPRGRRGIGELACGAGVVSAFALLGLSGVAQAAPDTEPDAGSSSATGESAAGGGAGDASSPGLGLAGSAADLASEPEPLSSGDPPDRSSTSDDEPAATTNTSSSDRAYDQDDAPLTASSSSAVSAPEAAAPKSSTSRSVAAPDTDPTPAASTTIASSTTYPDAGVASKASPSQAAAAVDSDAEPAASVPSATTTTASATTSPATTAERAPAPVTFERQLPQYVAAAPLSTGWGAPESWNAVAGAGAEESGSTSSVPDVEVSPPASPSGGEEPGAWEPLVPQFPEEPTNERLETGRTALDHWADVPLDSDPTSPAGGAGSSRGGGPLGPGNGGSRPTGMLGEAYGPAVSAPGDSGSGELNLLADGGDDGRASGGELPQLGFDAPVLLAGDGTRPLGHELLAGAGSAIGAFDDSSGPVPGASLFGGTDSGAPNPAAGSAGGGTPGDELWTFDVDTPVAGADGSGWSTDPPADLGLTPPLSGARNGSVWSGGPFGSRTDLSILGEDDRSITPGDGPDAMTNTPGLFRGARSLWPRAEAAETPPLGGDDSSGLLGIGDLDLDPSLPGSDVAPGNSLSLLGATPGSRGTVESNFLLPSLPRSTPTGSANKAPGAGVGPEPVLPPEALPWVFALSPLSIGINGLENATIIGSKHAAALRAAGAPEAAVAAALKPINNVGEALTTLPRASFIDATLQKLPIEVASTGNEDVDTMVKAGVSGVIGAAGNSLTQVFQSQLPAHRQRNAQWWADNNVWSSGKGPRVVVPKPRQITFALPSRPLPYALAPGAIAAAEITDRNVRREIGLFQPSASDTNNNNILGDIAMRSLAKGVGLTAAFSTDTLYDQYLLLGALRKLSPGRAVRETLPVLGTMAAQNAVAELLVTDPVVDDAMFRNLRSGAQFLADVGTGAKHVVTGPTDPTDGAGVNLTRGYANGLLAFGTPIWEAVTNSPDLGYNIENLVRNVRGDEQLPLVSDDTWRQSDRQLAEASSAIKTGLRQTPTTGLGATGVAAANIADGFGDAMIGTVEGLSALVGNRDGLTSAGNSFQESGRSFARARDAAGVAASESWKVATDLGTRGRNFVQYGDVGGAAAVAPTAPLGQPWCETSTLSACVERGSIDPSNPNSVGSLRAGPKVRAPGGQLMCSPVLTSNCVTPFSVDPANPNSVGQLRVGPKIVGAGVPGNPGYEQLVREGRAGDQSKPGSAGYGKGPAGVGRVGPAIPENATVQQLQQVYSTPAFAEHVERSFAQQEAARPPAPRVDVGQAARQAVTGTVQAATRKAQETATWAGDRADDVADAAQRAPVIGGAVGWLRNNVPGLGGDGDPNR